MGFFEAFFRALTALACAAAAVLIYVVMADAVTNVTVIQEGAYTVRFLAEQQGMTARHLATQATVQVWAREAGATTRTWIMWLVGGIVAAFVMWQAAKTVRHRQAERRRQQEILLLFAAHFLAGAPNVRVERAGGELVLRDYDTARQWPVQTAQAALAQRGMLTVDSH